MMKPHSFDFESSRFGAEVLERLLDGGLIFFSLRHLLASSVDFFPERPEFCFELAFLPLHGEKTGHRFPLANRRQRAARGVGLAVEGQEVCPGAALGNAKS